MALKYNGVNIASPDPIQYKPYTGTGFSIGNAINLAQTGQNQANNANNQRYGQGLNVLSKGYTQGAGFITNALNDINNVGASQLASINQQEKNGVANVQQGAIGRGIGNTTVLDTLGAIPQRSAELARLSLADQQAQARSGIRLQQAGQANAGANSISSFIAGRNDVAPSIGDYAPLVSAAAQAQAANTKPTGGKTTTTITKGTLSTPSFMTPQVGGGGGSLGSNTAISGGGMPSTGGGGDPIVPNPNGGGGGGTPIPQPNSPLPNQPPIPSQPPIPGQPNTLPPPGTLPPPQSGDPNKPGYISITPSYCNQPASARTPIGNMIHMCNG